MSHLSSCPVQSLSPAITRPHVYPKRGQVHRQRADLGAQPANHHRPRIPPGKHLDSWWTILRSGIWRLYFRLPAEGKARLFQEILPLLHDTKAAVLGDRDDDAWYLVYLGTKPNSQGRGYAARLLHDMMARVGFPRPYPPGSSLPLTWSP